MVSGIGWTGSPLALGDYARARTGATSTAGANAVVVDAASTTDAAITIRTTDGDTVSISLETETDATCAFYRRSGPEGVMAGAALTTSTRRDVAITVQGELDRNEISDIAHLLRRLGHAIRSLLGGRTNAALHQATANGHTDSLAGFSLDVERTNSLTAVWATTSDAGAPAPSVRPATEIPLGPPIPITVLQG
jgi:hypothetical protein